MRYSFVLRIIQVRLRVDTMLVVSFASHLHASIITAINTDKIKYILNVLRILFLID
jgi:hypothetical protein